MTAEERQTSLDEERLRLLSIGHLVSGGFTVLMALGFGFIFLVMFVVFANMPPPAPSSTTGTGHPVEPPPLFVFVFFGVFGFLIAVYGALDMLSAYFIAKRRHRLFCIIVSIPGILFVPWGTLVSVCTFIVLEQPSIRTLFTRDLPASSVRG